MPNDESPQLPERLTDPQVMRALSHPVRVALLEALAIRGQLTATKAADVIGETPTTCSFHLRQLAKYGLVEEVGGGTGRNRPWRAVWVGFTLSDEPGDDPATTIAGERLTELTLRRQLDRHAAWRRQRRGLPEPWRRLGGSVQTVWWVTPQEAAELELEITALALRYRERLLDPSRRPVGAAPVELVALTHLWDLDATVADSSGEQTDATVTPS